MINPWNLLKDLSVTATKTQARERKEDIEAYWDLAQQYGKQVMRKNIISNELADSAEGSGITRDEIECNYLNIKDLTPTKERKWQHELDHVRKGK